MHGTCKHRVQPGELKRRIVYFRLCELVHRGSRRPGSQLILFSAINPHFLRKCFSNPLSGGLFYPATSKMTARSTGVPSGRLATPYTRRQGLLSFPKTSSSNSEAASATFG